MCPCVCVLQSAAQQCGRVEEGDEVVQVNYETVVSIYYSGCTSRSNLRSNNFICVHAADDLRSY
jgi:hypothetical protein